MNTQMQTSDLMAFINSITDAQESRDEFVEPEPKPLESSSASTLIDGDGSFIDSLMDMQAEDDRQHEEFVNSTSLRDRIDGHTLPTYGYLKHMTNAIPKKGNPTGRVIKLNECDGLCVVDVDIKAQNKDKVINEILSVLPEDAVVVETCSHGLHIYCNYYGCSHESNRLIKCYTCDDYDIDILMGNDKSKFSGVMAPESKARKDHAPVGTYTFLRGNFDSFIVNDREVILIALGIMSIDVRTEDEKKDEELKFDEVELTEDEYRLIINGFDSHIKVHNDGGSMKLEDEVTTFTLFPAINSLPNKFINDAYDHVYNNCTLTPACRTCWSDRWTRYSNRITHPGILRKILKIHNPEYYNTNLIALNAIAKPQITINEINFDDDFYLEHITRNAKEGKYHNEAEALSDLTKVMRYISAFGAFAMKRMNSTTNAPYLSFEYKSKIRDDMKEMILFNDEKGKPVNAYTVFLHHKDVFAKVAYMFYSTNPDVISYFHGYKYNTVQTPDMSIIQKYLDFVHDVIADGDENSFNYIQSWIANMMQNPGQINGTALILRSLQGCGKTIFTDIISKMMTGYSEANLDDIEDITNFNSVLENKMFVVVNELCNHGDSRRDNFDKLKTHITDKTVRINEKCVVKRTIANTTNFVFVSNNAVPIRVEQSDRRYAVFEISAKHIKDRDYYRQICESTNSDEFYSNLTAYYLNYNLNGFDPRNIPETEARKCAQNLSRGPLDQWLCDHYNELCEGIQPSVLRSLIPAEIEPLVRKFGLATYCNKVRHRIDGKQVWFYELKDEYRTVFAPSTNVYDDGEIYDDEDVM